MHQHKLVVFIGPPGVGQSYLMRYLATAWRSLFRIVRAATTREQFEPEETMTWDFLTDEEFLHRATAGTLTPSGNYRGKQYGIYLEGTREIIAHHHGIIALTDSGIHAYGMSPDIALAMRVVELKPESPEVLRENLTTRRGLRGEALENELARAAAWRPSVPPHATLVMRGRHNDLEALAEELTRQLRLT